MTPPAIQHKENSMKYDPSIVIDSLGGKCPCQGSGTIYGQPFYFRARGGGWTLEVCEPGEDPVSNGKFYYAEGEDPTCGWMESGPALAIIAQHLDPIWAKIHHRTGA